MLDISCHSDLDFAPREGKAKDKMILLIAHQPAIATQALARKGPF
jgi:hypothetical protein